MYRIRDWLYISNYRSSRNSDVLKSYKIGALLQLAELIQHPDIACLYLAVDDGTAIEPDKLKRGIAFIREQKAAGRVVLSACGAGISRSTTFALGALIEEENLSWQDAYTSILAQHPHAMPHASLVQSLLAYLGEEVPPFVELWKAISDLQRRHGASG